MITQHDDVVSGCKWACQIKNRILGESPVDICFRQAMLLQKIAVTARGNCADMTELHRVTNDNRRFRSKEQRQQRCDVALARLVNNKKVEESCFKRNSSACR